MTIYKKVWRKPSKGQLARSYLLSCSYITPALASKEQTIFYTKCFNLFRALLDRAVRLIFHLLPLQSRFAFYTKIKHHHREASFKILSKQNIKDGAPTGNRTSIPALKKKINKQRKTQRHKDEQTDKHK